MTRMGLAQRGLAQSLAGQDDAVLTADIERKPRGIQSVVIGFRILDCLAEAPGPLSLKELGQAVGMPSSKLRFYLVSFLELGLVMQHGPNGRYDLGPAALKLGLSALEKIDVVRMIRNEIGALSEALGYSVFIAVWGSHGPTIIDRADGRNRTVLEIRVGSVLPLLASACGRVFATFMPKAAVAPLIRNEKRQWAGSEDSAPFENDPDLCFETIHATRFARGHGKVLAGFTAIASPVLDRAGAPVAVLSVVGAVGKLPDDPDQAPARALLDVTTRLSQQLGWRDPNEKGQE